MATGAGRRRRWRLVGEARDAAPQPLLVWSCYGTLWPSVSFSGLQIEFAASNVFSSDWNSVEFVTSRFLQLDLPGDWDLVQSVKGSYGAAFFFTPEPFLPFIVGHCRHCQDMTSAMTFKVPCWQLPADADTPSGWFYSAPGLHPSSRLATPSTVMFMLRWKPAAFWMLV
jgi:hypothetical protein